jgi:hypothetical protein
MLFTFSRGASFSRSGSDLQEGPAFVWGALLQLLILPAGSPASVFRWLGHWRPPNVNRSLNLVGLNDRVRLVVWLERFRTRPRVEKASGHSAFYFG